MVPSGVFCRFSLGGYAVGVSRAGISRGISFREISFPLLSPALRRWGGLSGGDPYSEACETEDTGDSAVVPLSGGFLPLRSRRVFFGEGVGHGPYSNWH